MWFMALPLDAKGSFIFLVEAQPIKVKQVKQDAVQYLNSEPNKQEIALHIKDMDLLSQVQEYFNGIGNKHVDKTRKRVIYSIDS